MHLPVNLATFWVSTKQDIFNIQQILQSEDIVEIALFTPIGQECKNADFIAWMTVKSNTDASRENLLNTISKLLSLVNYSFNKLSENNVE